ncbi:28S ribosomal S34 protein [Rhynchospora pubera]|uniref:28S ribosomal S34 protein n=1 Tax=Rhynchospora pubera TaxID=906938 RepID=A0AAV8HNT7_9POAL|nr:28S ribosomal S34 protein [Rhynchospora pubera]
MAMAMAAAANKAVAERSFCLLRQSLGLLRNLSAAASPPQATASGDAEKSKRKKKKNLFDVVQFLPKWGIGYKVAKSHWRDVSYEITKINLYKDGRHGKAWGIRYKAGVQVGDEPIKISGVNKRGWKYLKESDRKAQDLPKEREQITA